MKKNPNQANQPTKCIGEPTVEKRGSVTLEQHFERTSRVIASWPSWKKGLVTDMKESFAVKKSNRIREVAIVHCKGESSKIKDRK